MIMRTFSHKGGAGGVSVPVVVIVWKGLVVVVVVLDAIEVV